MWFFKKTKKSEHIHCWTNWEPYAESLQQISDSTGKPIKQFRVIEQRRRCGLCGYIEIDAQKIITGSVSIDDIGKKLK